ncbi:MAG: hypothetical protein AB8G22_26205 [Saprospiraceae bacterium]
MTVPTDFAAEKNGGWHDAFNGLLLLGYSGLAFEPYSAAESGFFVPNDGRSIVKMEDESGKDIYVAGQNKGTFKFFRKSK